jgi:hypothetical protein
MIKLIKQFIFGVRREPVESFYEGVTTLQYEKPEYNEWCKQLNVSIRYKK